MVIDQGKTLVGIPLVAYITGLIMQATPDDSISRGLLLSYLWV